MYLKLREDVSFRSKGRDLEFHGVNGVKFKDVPATLARMAKRLEFGVDGSFPFSKRERQMLSELGQRGLLIRTPSMEDRNAIWNAHFDIEGGNLESKSVFVIGCGGTGAIIADHLARAGVGYIGLIDGALLDDPDLNRQFTYRKADIGRPKARLLKDHLKAETGVKVLEAHNKYLTKENLACVQGRYDLIINCADRPKHEIQRLALRLGDKKNCPVLFGSVGVRDYIVGPFVRGQDQKSKFLKQIEREASFFEQSDKVIKASNPLLNTKAAVEMAIRSFEYLSGERKLNFERLAV